MKVLVTGANGFVGKNLIFYLLEKVNCEILKVTRETSPEELELKLLESDFIFHLAGENRPNSIEDFYINNSELTKKICETLKKNNKSTEIVYTSSVQSDLDNDYGKSKKEAEIALEQYSIEMNTKVFVYKLPNIFGKWSRPNYNSVVATFSYNILNNLEIVNNDPSRKLNLLYIDDLVEVFGKVLKDREFVNISTVYQITLGELESVIKSFKESRTNHTIEKVGTSLTGALYSTYLSFMQPRQFIYDLEEHEDVSGIFVDMLKTKDSGKFSFLTIRPGITRGGDYHQSRIEKNLIIKGSAKFAFRNIITNERYFLETSGSKSQIVEIVPGWIHDITNIGEEEMIVMLWSNEVHSSHNPDKFTKKV